MPEVETVLLMLVVAGSLAGGLFMKAKPGFIVLIAAFTYFIVAFFAFDKSESLWFVTLMMGFCLAAVGAMVGAFSGRALSKLFSGRR
ncbi:MAG: hypothetical protein WA948_02335 [Pontixanthobacter sp.]